MDGSSIEYSDSDSGESWTLLDHAPAFVADSPSFEGSLKHGGNVEENIEKDEDTDGISIISDSDPESSTPCELNYDKSSQEEENHPTEQQMFQDVLEKPPSNNSINHNESIRSEDFLGDNAGKLKTYVHKRNKRLSTVLNIIVLGSVITAAGVAIGHMWGVRDDCAVQSTPSVNKILSNLYKLQEENAYLRNKIKELTLINNIQMTQRKFESKKLSLKQNRCKTLYEASLDNKNIDKLTKCMDENNNANNNDFDQPEYQKEFLGDIEKLKMIYKQNKSWLDEEISKRLKSEKLSTKNLKTNLKSTKVTKDIGKTVKDENLKLQLEPVIEPLIEETLGSLVEPTITNRLKNTNIKIKSSEQKVTYADSLKSNKANENKNKRIKRYISEFHGCNNKENIHRKKPKKEYDTLTDNTLSEDELRKEDRYFGPKCKHERKKHDRQKMHKKQKRRNKYEQWEMKGGYMKDYDDYSITSSKENENNLKNSNKDDNNDFEKNEHIDQFSETDSNVKSKFKYSKNKGDKENKELNWYEKMAIVRQEARNKLEKELFDKTESSPNNARWYFRRMQRREQCRAKGDNSTYRKLSKRNMNFKMKH